MVSTDNGRVESMIDEELGSVGAPTADADHNDIPLLVKTKEDSLGDRTCWSVSKRWMRVPLKIVTFVWTVCATISVTISVLCLYGLLNGLFPSKSRRDTFVEANNQVTNALFTLMCLYVHPERFYHLFLLHRWQPEDKVKLREVYCKDGTEKPNERKHMLVVVILLHVGCFVQYAICGLNVGYPAASRPVVVLVLGIVVAISAGVTAKYYTKRSSLGKDYDNEKDPKAQDQVIST